MESFIRDLFFFMDERCSAQVESPACRRAFHILFGELDKLEALAGGELRDSIYDTAMRCIGEERYAAFRLGVRLGLQLHTL